MKSIIVTGATSTLGSALIEAVARHDPSCKVYAVVRPDTTKLNRLSENKNISIIECEASKYDSLSELITGEAEVFYHMAWTSAGKYRNSDIMEQSRNIDYTLQALSAAHALGCRKFISAGSQAEFGIKNLDIIAPMTEADPIEVYGIAKYAAGKLARIQAERYNMDCLWVRVFSVYGKYEKDSTMIQSTIRKLKVGERPSFTPSEQMWDYLYTADAGDAFYAIGEKASGNKIYCLGSGKSRPLKEYISIIGRLVNSDVPLGIGDLPYPPNAVMNLCADISELQHDTGWKPTTSFEDGILGILDTWGKS